MEHGIAYAHLSFIYKILFLILGSSKEKLPAIFIPIVYRGARFRRKRSLDKRRMSWILIAVTAHVCPSLKKNWWYYSSRKEIYGSSAHPVAWLSKKKGFCNPCTVFDVFSPQKWFFFYRRKIVHYATRQWSSKGMIDFSHVLHIILYSYLHCGHFINFKSYFVFMCCNLLVLVKFTIINVKNVRTMLGNRTRLLLRFSGYKVAIIVEMGIKVFFRPKAMKIVHVKEKKKKKKKKKSHRKNTVV